MKNVLIGLSGLILGVLLTLGLRFPALAPAGIDEAINYKRECGSGMHSSMLRLANGNLAPGAPRMLDIWDDKVATPRKDDPKDPLLYCNAKAAYSDTTKWTIRYMVHEERGRTWSQIGKLERIKD